MTLRLRNEHKIDLENKEYFDNFKTSSEKKLEHEIKNGKYNFLQFPAGIY